MERRKEIKNLIENIGLWNISKTELAKKYEVSRQTIYTDIERIIENMPNEEINEVMLELSSAYKKGIKEARKILLTSNKPKEKLKAIEVINHSAKGFTEMLEAYGLKQKVPDRIESVEVGITLEELKRLKNKLTR